MPSVWSRPETLVPYWRHRQVCWSPSKGPERERQDGGTRAGPRPFRKRERLIKNLERYKKEGGIKERGGIKPRDGRVDRNKYVSDTLIDHARTTKGRKRGGNLALDGLVHPINWKECF